MSTTYKYQELFAQELTQAWLDGKQEHVRTVIRNLKNKAQAAHIASLVTLNLARDLAPAVARNFNDFIHPNNR
jgi:hypothetical protein